MDSGAPLGQSLSEEIAEKFLDLGDASFPLSETIALVDAEDGRRRINEWLSKRLGSLTPSNDLLQLPSFRWKAIYTVNHDALVEKAYEAAEASLQRLHPIYSDRDSISHLEPDEVPYYKLHGCITRANSPEGRLVLTQDDFARVEMSRQRLFNRLLDHLSDMPMLYIGFARADPDFARVLAAMEKAAGDLVELTRSYAVQPGFLPAESKRAELKKVTLLNATSGQFFAALSASVAPEARKGHDRTETGGFRSALTRRRPDATSRIVGTLIGDYEVLDDALEDAQSDPEAFYKGSLPSWGDVAMNVDGRRDAQDSILETVLVDPAIDRGTAKLVLLHAEAGAGKTTLLRRIGAELVQTWDAVVLALKPFGALDVLDVERLSNALDERIYLLVDDALRIAPELRDFLDAARRAKVKVSVLAAARTNEWRESADAQVLNPGDEFELEALSRVEIDHVLDRLAEHGHLGYLEGVPREGQREAFETRAQKQLLVALREATEGKAFDDIVVDEFDRIPSEDAQTAYLYVAALHRFGLLTRAAVLHRALGIPLTQLGDRVFGPATKIIVPQDLHGDAEPYYGTRHPLIAEIVFDRKVSTESDRVAFYVSLIRELDLGYASDADTYRRLSRSLNKSLLRDFEKQTHKREVMREIQELDPTDALVHQHAAMMELAGGNLKEASAHIVRAIEERPNDVAIRDTEGRIMLARVEEEVTPPRKLARLAEAEQIFSRNIARRPGEPFGYRHLAETYWLRSRVEQEAATRGRFIGEAYRVLADGLDNAVNTTMLMQYRATLEDQTGNRAEARQLLDAALRERPDDVPMRVMAARIAERDADLGGAIEILRKGVETTPDAWELHYALAQALTKDDGADRDEITRHFAASLLAPTRRYRPRLAYAVWLFSLGEYTKAADQFSRFESLEVPVSERFEARTFRFGTLGDKHRGRVTRLSYANGHVEFDGGGTRIFFRTRDLPDGATVRNGSELEYDLRFNLLGPLAVHLRP